MNGRLRPFEQAVLNLPPIEKFLESWRRPGVSDNELRKMYAEMSRQEVWKNNEYQVNIDKTPEHGFPGEVWHLSVKRLKKEPIHDWRDLQAIKNMLVGPEFEAIEVYPASSRVVDSANQYHLWAFIELAGASPWQVPVGWITRMVEPQQGPGVVQRGLHRNGDTL